AVGNGDIASWQRTDRRVVARPEHAGGDNGRAGVGVGGGDGDDTGAELLHRSTAADHGGRGPIVGAVVVDGPLVVADGCAGVPDAGRNAIADVDRRAGQDVQRSDGVGDGV